MAGVSQTSTTLTPRIKTIIVLPSQEHWQNCNHGSPTLQGIPEHTIAVRRNFVVTGDTLASTQILVGFAGNELETGGTTLAVYRAALILELIAQRGVRTGFGIS
jgi:hypothetical protein